ncbi:hypothetical protein KCV00_g2, partial [Aureobasidium melanogenum]
MCDVKDGADQITSGGNSDVSQRKIKNAVRSTTLPTSVTGMFQLRYLGTDLRDFAAVCPLQVQEGSQGHHKHMSGSKYRISMSAQPMKYCLVISEISRQPRAVI